MPFAEYPSSGKGGSKNPKFEYRNPKRGKGSLIPVSDFEFRASNFI